MILRPIAIAAAVLAGMPVAARADQITVFAAASLKDALDVVSQNWQTETGNQVVLSYAGSGQLANQILQGAPADLFISASPEWMDKVVQSMPAITNSRVDILGNSLVLVQYGVQAPPVTLDNTLDLAALVGSGKLAIGLVDSVPAGFYGKQALEELGLWEKAEPLLAQSENVRAALALVATGEAPLGIVYASDAVASQRAGEPVSVVATFPPASHDEIRYPSALISDAPAAAAFLNFLSSAKATKVFVDQGFVVLNR